jgi:hypothetical protein
MPNPNPWKARLAKAAKQTPSDIEAFRRRTWGLLCLAYDDCGVTDPDLHRKSLLAYSRLASVYAKLLELSHLDQRIKALEEHTRAESTRKT